MKYPALQLFFLLLFLIILGGCDNAKNTKPHVEKSKPIDWEIALQQATSFQEETQLLAALIQQDTSNIHQQLIANRLQTFDLRHLQEVEKLTILDLYERSLQPIKKPATPVFQIAYAKLSAVYPTNNRTVDEKISSLLTLIKENAGEGFEF